MFAIDGCLISMRSVSDKARTDPSATEYAMSRTSPVRELVALVIRYLRGGAVAPGGKLPPERELAAVFGVSRSHIREALKALDLLGMIDIRQGDGTYLRTSASSLLPDVVEWGLFLATPQAAELIDARAEIEVSLARLAARRITEEDAIAIRRRVDEMDRATTAADFAGADVEFHRAIAIAARNGVLADMLGSIRALIRVWVERVLAESPDFSALRDQHRAIADAVLSGDPAAAGQAMDEHMSAVTASLRASLAAHDPDGAVSPPR
jgi:GntR family transcriptional regulator, transcriptional repressor for pyruvate dehydrogenase complex